MAGLVTVGPKTFRPAQKTSLFEFKQICSTMAAAHLGSRHAKTLEKIFTSLGTSCDKKINELNENYSEQKEWLRASVVNTKEKK